MSVTPVVQTTAPAPVPSDTQLQQPTNGEGTNKPKVPSPPAQIVSDIPGVASSATSSAIPPATSTAPVNGGAFSNGPTPAATAMKPSPHPEVIKWRAQLPQASQSHPPSTPRKVPIVDPPAKPPTPAAGFPSPGAESAHLLPKFNEDRTKISFGIQQALPAAVRRAIRDNWEKCLIGSNFHQAFVLNATIHHAPPTAVKRGIQGFGTAMVAAAKHEIMDKMTTADLDEVAYHILDKASDSFLDKALEKRLKSIGAKHLINALARAERLGYEPSDVQEDNDPPLPAAAPVVPSNAQINVPPNTASAVPSQTMPPRDSKPLCGLCHRTFDVDWGYQYHTRHKVCQRASYGPNGFKFACQFCGQGFESLPGLNYHYANKICFPTPTEGQQKPSTASTPIGTGKRPGTTSWSSPKTPASAAPSPSILDPYAHLSREQLASLQADLDLAEIQYTERIREANAIPDEAARKAKLDGLSNSFSTKQSLIRKKYGVRLRMRRRKEEIEAERNRMFYNTPSELQAKMGILNPGTRPRNKPKLDSNESSRPGSSSEMSTPEPVAKTTLASSLPVPKSNETHDSNDVSMHGGGHKRSHSGDGEIPSHKRIAYAEMGGLGGGDAPAETMDPTMPKRAGVLSDERPEAGTLDEPMVLDDSIIESGENDEDSSSSDDDDEDIPAQLPASVLHSLQRSSSTPKPDSS